MNIKIEARSVSTKPGSSQSGMVDVTLDVPGGAFDDIIAQVWDAKDDDWMANYFKLNGYELKRLPSEPT